MFHLFGALAKFERSLIRERTQAGTAAARRARRRSASTVPRWQGILFLLRSYRFKEETEKFNANSREIRLIFRKQHEPKRTAEIRKCIQSLIGTVNMNGVEPKSDSTMC